MYVQPYLIFEGRADEAVAFYKKAVGAEVASVMRFKDAPDQSMVSPGSKDKVMHGTFKIGDTVILFSDGRNQGNPKFDGFSLTIQCRDAAETTMLFNALGEGGEVTMPLSETFFAHKFGMLKDKFGVNWIVLAAKPM